MRKLQLVLLVSALSLLLCSCGSQDQPAEVASATDTATAILEETAPNSTTEEPEEAEPEEVAAAQAEEPAPEANVSEAPAAEAETAGEGVGAEPPLTAAPEETALEEPSAEIPEIPETPIASESAAAVQPEPEPAPQADTSGADAVVTTPETPPQEQSFAPEAESAAPSPEAPESQTVSAPAQTIFVPTEQTEPAAEAAPAPSAGSDAFSIAQGMIGQTTAALFAAIGQPSASDYAPSCIGAGEDGNLYYDGFTVYTYREGGVETISFVE